MLIVCESQAVRATSDENGNSECARDASDVDEDGCPGMEEVFSYCYPIQTRFSSVRSLPFLPEPRTSRTIGLIRQPDPTLPSLFLPLGARCLRTNSWKSTHWPSGSGFRSRVHTGQLFPSACAYGSPLLIAEIDF